MSDRWGYDTESTLPMLDSLWHGTISSFWQTDRQVSPWILLQRTTRSVDWPTVCGRRRQRGRCRWWRSGRRRPWNATGCVNDVVLRHNVLLRRRLARWSHQRQCDRVGIGTQLVDCWQRKVATVAIRNADDVKRYGALRFRQRLQQLVSK